MKRILFSLIVILGAAALAAPFVLRDAEQVIVLPSSSDSLQQTMEGIFAAERTADIPRHPIRAVIVPHHLTAARAIASGIRMLTGEDRGTVILLSPDHFGACPTLLCTTHGTLRTILGDISPDEEAVRALTESRLVTVHPDLFEREHGIGAVSPFIRHYLPDASVVPIVLSTEHAWHGMREEILALLESLLDDGATLVVSSDFSHYLPLSEAERMDEATAEALFAKDLDGIARLQNPAQSDCPGCLWLLAALADRMHFYNPSVVLHTNSATILHDPDVPETTSHFAMAWYANAHLSAEDPAFGGDVTVTRGRPRPLAERLQTFWEGTGIRVLNLEGPLAEQCAEHPNPFIFCNPLERFLSFQSMATLWGTRNNHMFDQGEEGLPTTVALLATKALDQPRGVGSVRVYPLTMIMNPVDGIPSGIAAGERERTLEALRQAGPEILDVVYLHYGREYVALPNEQERTVLRSFIDAGADAVIGMHTHVQGDMELYRGKPIFYGIGNFLFDQYDAVATSTARAVRLRLEDGAVLFETMLGRLGS